MAATVESRAHADRKRAELLGYTLTHLAPHQAVRAIVAFGSVATGLARADSDIDAVIFMDPLDLYLAPAEAIWRPRDDSYHSIFTDDPTLLAEGIQLDLHRLDLALWRSPHHLWPEHVRAELAEGWVAYDPADEISQLLRERTGMPDQQRREILDEVLVEVAGLLPQEAHRAWSTLGSDEAFDRLQAAYEALARGLFAVNGKWRPWRSRSLRSLQQLDFQPSVLRTTPADLVRTAGGDQPAYSRRADALKDALAELTDQLQRDGLYGDDPVSEAFIRLHDEPGRAWNIKEWSTRYRTTS